MAFGLSARMVAACITGIPRPAVFRAIGAFLFAVIAVSTSIPAGAVRPEEARKYRISP